MRALGCGCGRLLAAPGLTRPVLAAAAPRAAALPAAPPAAKLFYAVAGLSRVFRSLAEAEGSVGNRPASYQSFYSKQQAQAWLEQRDQQATEQAAGASHRALSTDVQAGAAAARTAQHASPSSSQDDAAPSDAASPSSQSPALKGRRGRRKKEAGAPEPAHRVQADAWYRLEFDGGSRGNPGPAGFGSVLRHSGTGEVVQVAAGIIPRNTTNNQAEYAALLAGLKAAHALGVRRLAVQGDSELIVRQLTGRYRASKEGGLAGVLAEATALLSAFEGHRVAHVPRAHNKDADALCNIAMDVLAGRRAVPVAERPSLEAALRQQASGAGGLAELHACVVRALLGGAHTAVVNVAAEPTGGSPQASVQLTPCPSPPAPRTAQAARTRRRKPAVVSAAAAAAVAVTAAVGVACLSLLPAAVEQAA